MSAPDLDALVARALTRLREPESAHLARGVDLVVEAALSRPLRDVVDPARMVDLAAQAIDEEKVERALATVVRPAMDRQREALASRGETLGAFLPEGASVLLDDIAAGTRPPRGAWSRDLVDPSHLRELLAPVLQETLLAFARKLPLVGGGGGEESGRAGKLLGGLARGFAQGAGERAQKLADLGRGVLGGLGAEMEKRIGTAAKDFSQSAFEPLRDAFQERIESEDGRAILKKMRRHAIDVLLAAKAAELLDDLDAAPRAPVDRLIARSIARDVARPEMRALLVAEVEAFLAQRDGWTVRQLLDEWGLTASAIDEAKRFGMTVASTAVKDDAFGTWLRALLDE